MQIDHTAAEPPNQGRICLAISGWTRNSRKALVKMVPANSALTYAGRMPAAPREKPLIVMLASPDPGPTSARRTGC